MKEEKKGPFDGLHDEVRRMRWHPFNNPSIPHKITELPMINDDIGRKEYVIPSHLTDQMLNLSFDFNVKDRFSRELTGQTERVAAYLNESLGLPASFFNNNKNKQVKTFEKKKQYVTICANQGIKDSLMEYARASGVPTLCANPDNYKTLPHIGWSGASICGFDAQSSAVNISVHTFIMYCDTWKEAQRPVIKLNHEQTIKVIYEDNIVLAGCHHQYRLPFKLIDEIHAKIHEQDSKKELVKFSTYEWLPVFNSALYYSSLKTAQQHGLKFNGGEFEGGNFGLICLFFDTLGGIQWGNKMADAFTRDKELSQSDFLERCINHNK